MIQENFQTNLKELRKSRKLTQDELGEILGMRGQSIYKYENGINFPSADTLEKIVNYFKIDANYLFGLTAHDENNDVLSLLTKHLHIMREVGDLVRNNQEQFALDFLYSMYPYLEGYDLETILKQEKIAFYTTLYDLVQYKRESAFNGKEENL